MIIIYITLMKIAGKQVFVEVAIMLTINTCASFYIKCELAIFG